MQCLQGEAGIRSQRGVTDMAQSKWARYQWASRWAGTGQREGQREGLSLGQRWARGQGWELRAARREHGPVHTCGPKSLAQPYSVLP